ncbi:MAG: hypothetical protein AAFY76_14095, partial [Cyanobacteria bacterium J06649_11]
MLKHLLLSGWFRVQPFLKYVLVVILIAPLVVASGHSSSAKQSEANKVNAEVPELDSVLVEVPIASEYRLSQPEAVKSLTSESDSESMKMAAVVKPQIIQPDVVESLTIETTNRGEEVKPSNEDPFIEVELAPPATSTKVVPRKFSANGIKLVQRLKAAKIQSSKKDALVAKLASAKLAGAKSLKQAKVVALRRNTIPHHTDAPVSEEPQESELSQEDPIGSPHSIPWKWITA